jgi:hypothetical protein
MVKMSAFRNSFLSSIGLGKAAPDMEALRGACVASLAGVPASDRKAMLQRLAQMRRRDDVWHLRAALFDTISQAHGESVARERIVQLDAVLA